NVTRTPLADNAHGNGAIDRQLAGDLGEIGSGSHYPIVQIGDDITRTQANHGTRARTHLTNYHTGGHIQAFLLFVSQLDYGDPEAVVVSGRSARGWHTRARGHGVVFRQGTNLDLQLLALAVPDNVHRSHAAGTHTTDRVGQIGGHDDVFAVELEDDITGLQATLVTGATRHHLGDQRTSGAFQTEGFSQVLVHFLDNHPQPATADRAFALQLFDHVHCHIHRDGERQAHEATGTGEDLGVNAHYLALEVE